jgi:hypothetical protein
VINQVSGTKKILLFRITHYRTFVHCLVFWKKKVSKTGYISIPSSKDLEEHIQLDPTKAAGKNTDWPLFPFCTCRGNFGKTQVPKLIHTMVVRPRFTYTAVMWWPGVKI